MSPQGLDDVVSELSPDAAGADAVSGSAGARQRQDQPAEALRLLQPRYGHDGRPADRRAHLRHSALAAAREVVRTVAGGERERRTDGWR